jgi:pimeloyl-ACP methyl ester carboxylesterase
MARTLEAIILEPLDTPTLPSGIRARFVDDINGLRMHVLEAGFRDAGRGHLLLLHGFPELAYSWRKVMLPLAAAGYHVVAPLRGYSAPPAGMPATTAPLAPFACSTSCAMCSALSPRSATARSPAASGTTTARRLLHGARWCGRMYSAR